MSQNAFPCPDCILDPFFSILASVKLHSTGAHQEPILSGRFFRSTIAEHRVKARSGSEGRTAVRPDSALKIAHAVPPNHVPTRATTTWPMF